MATPISQLFKLMRTTNSVFIRTQKPVARRTIYADLDFKQYPARVTPSLFNGNSVVLKSHFSLGSLILSDKVHRPYEQDVLSINHGVIVPALENAIYPHESYNAITPDLLYSIPQSVWEEFIRSLNPQIIEVLNLKKHRHLWSAYNYAAEASTEEIALKRAKLIGQHHFVLGIFYYNSLMDNSLEGLLSSSHDCNSEEWYELKRNCNRFQRALKERNFFDYQLAQTLHPAFTPRFLNKVAHYSDITEVIQLGDALLHYSSTMKVFDPHTVNKSTYGSFMTSGLLKFTLDSKKINDAMNWLPSSTENPKEFSQSIKLISTLSGANLGFFFPSRESWNKDKIPNEINQLIFDYGNALFEDLILRQILQKAQEKNLAAQSVLISQIGYKFRQLIATSHNISRINKLQERWHGNIEAIEQAKPFSSKRVWMPLITQACIEGITITPIISEIELKSHGREMRHCVGGYAQQCQENKSNIFELVDEQNNKSTLNVVCANGKFEIQEHKAYQNTVPNTQHRAVSAELMRQINERIIPINQDRLNERSTYSQIQGDFPYPIDRLDIQDEIYGVYKQKKVLPPMLIAESYEEMLEQSGLRSLIDDVIAEYLLNIQQRFTARR